MFVAPVPPPRLQEIADLAMLTVHSELAHRALEAPAAATVRLLPNVLVYAQATDIGTDGIAVARSWNGRTVFLAAKQSAFPSEEWSQITTLLERVRVTSVNQAPEDRPFRTYSVNGSLFAAYIDDAPTSQALQQPSATPDLTGLTLSQIATPVAGLRAKAAADLGSQEDDAAVARFDHAVLRYRVAPGTTLTGLTARLGLSVETLRAYNSLPQNVDPNAAISGEIKIPGTQIAAGGSDTFQSIAARTSTSASALALLNESPKLGQPVFVPLVPNVLRGVPRQAGTYAAPVSTVSDTQNAAFREPAERARQLSGLGVPPRPAREARLFAKYGDQTWPSLQAMPAELRAYYVGLASQIERDYGVPAEAVLAVRLAEQMGSGFRPFETRVSSAKAVGDGQITPGYWNGWKSGILGRFLSDPKQIAQLGGFGVDYDKDTVANVNSIADNMAATALGLRASGVTAQLRNNQPKVYSDNLAQALSYYNSGKPLQTAPAETRAYAAIGIRWEAANRNLTQAVATVVAVRPPDHVAAVAKAEMAEAPVASLAKHVLAAATASVSQVNTWGTTVQGMWAIAQAETQTAAPSEYALTAQKEAQQAKIKTDIVQALSGTSAVKTQTKTAATSNSGSFRASKADANAIVDLRQFGAAAAAAPASSSDALVDAYRRAVDTNFGLSLSVDQARQAVDTQPDVTADYHQGKEDVQAAVKRLMDKQTAAYRAQASEALARKGQPVWPFFVNAEAEAVQHMALERLGHFLDYPELKGLIGDRAINPNGRINLPSITNYLSTRDEAALYAFAHGLYTDALDGQADHAYTPNLVLVTEVQHALEQTQGKADDAARQILALRLRASAEYGRVHTAAKFPSLGAPFRAPDGSLAKYQIRQINPPNGRTNSDFMHGNIDYYAEMARGARAADQSWYGVDFTADRNAKVVAMMDGVVEEILEGTPVDGPGDSVLIRGSGAYAGMTVRSLHLRIDPAMKAEFYNSKGGLPVKVGDVIGIQDPAYGHTHIILHDARGKDIPVARLLRGQHQPTSVYGAGSYVDLSVPNGDNFRWLDEPASILKWVEQTARS